jgi:hypothetical protein
VRQLRKGCQHSLYVFRKSLLLLTTHIFVVPHPTSTTA